jgi:hypothetical protein
VPQTLRSFCNRSDQHDPDCVHNGHDLCDTAGIRHDWRKVAPLNQPMDEAETVRRPAMSPACAEIAVANCVPEGNPACSIPFETASPCWQSAVC